MPFRFSTPTRLHSIPAFCIAGAVVSIATLFLQASADAQVAETRAAGKTASSTQKNAASSAKPILSPFQAALASYDKDEHDMARKQLQEIPEAERSAEVQAMLYRLRLSELLQESGERNKAAGGSLNPLESFIQINQEAEKIIEQLEAIQVAHPDSAIVHEMAGELTIDVASMLIMQVAMLRSMTHDETAFEYEGRSSILRSNAQIAFEKCVKLDDNRPLPHLRLAGLIGTQRGHLNDARITNHVFKAIEIAPESAAPVNLLVAMMYTTSLLENPKNLTRTRDALQSLKGKARGEIRKQIGEVRSILRDAQIASEQIAATGFDSPEVDEQITRLSATLMELNTAIASSN